jgi:PAS domain S-box-containing protein
MPDFFHLITQFREILESIPDAIVIVRQEGNIAAINAQTERMFGYAREELIGQPVEILMPKRFRDVHPGHVNKFLAEPQARSIGSGLEFFAMRKDGTEFPVQISLSPIKVDEGLAVLSVICDISNRKREERLHGELAAILESSVDAIFSQTLDSKITSWNQGAERMFTQQKRR